MRVLAVTPWWPRAVGNQEGSFIRDQVDALRSGGTEVDVLAVPSDLIARPGTIATVPFRWLPGYFAHGLEARLLATRLRAVSALANRDFDLVHAHEETCGIACSRVIGDVPLVVTIHGTTTSARAHRSQLRRADLLSMAKKSRLVVVGRPLLQNDWMGDGRPTVVHNGYSRERFEFAPMPAFPPLRVASVSNLYPSKGVAVTIGAVAAARKAGAEVQLQVIGDGPERRSLQHLANHLGVSDSVTFRGRIGRNEVAIALRSSHIMCLPSAPEAFGVAYLEALGTGRPVIACEGQGPADFVEEDVDGWLVQPHDVAAVARCLCQAAADPARLEAMGVHGEEKVRRQYTWQATARRLLAIYHEEVP